MESTNEQVAKEQGGLGLVGSVQLRYCICIEEGNGSGPGEGVR